MQEGTILKVNNLNVVIEGEKILEDLNFEVKEGETFVILGPNGAGKTVLLKTLLGLIPHSGDIAWKQNIRIGYAPQRLPFIKDFPLSVREFFELKKTSIGEIKKVLEAVGMAQVGRQAELCDKKIGTLSSGQFQRVLIAWALLGDPQVLFFDEPTAGIDVGGEETIYTLLKKLKEERNLTIFLVSHDLGVVYRQANKVLCLNHKKVCYGLPKEVLTSENIDQLFGGETAFYHHDHD